MPPPKREPSQGPRAEQGGPLPDGAVFARFAARGGRLQAGRRFSLDGRQTWVACLLPVPLPELLTVGGPGELKEEPVFGPDPWLKGSPDGLTCLRCCPSRCVFACIVDPVRFLAKQTWLRCRTWGFFLGSREPNWHPNRASPPTPASTPMQPPHLPPAETITFVLEFSKCRRSASQTNPAVGRPMRTTS